LLYKNNWTLTPLMAAGRRNDSFDPRWLVPALSALLTDRQSQSPVALVLLVDGNPIQVTIVNDGPRVELLDEVPAGTQAVLRTTPETALALAAKALTPEQAISCDRSYTGSPETICAVLG
jgi:hypothetical protein